VPLGSSSDWSEDGIGLLTKEKVQNESDEGASSLRQGMQRLPEDRSRACVSDFKAAGVAVDSRQLCLNPIDISAAGICRRQNVDEVRSGATKLDE
jgi:hypothetical protein